MSSRIDVIVGEACTGKTAALLNEYRQTLDAERSGFRLGTTLWLSPTERARRQVLDRLCDHSPQAMFRPNVFTFRAFAEKILAAGFGRVTPLSVPMQRTLLRRVVSGLLAEGRLAHFSPIAQTAGFLDLLESFIAELKRCETWPDEFEAACAQRGHRRLDAEVAEVYRRYQRLLLERGVYDAEGCFWSACQALEQGHWGSFGALTLVVVDGFTDFTHTQHRILALLAQRAARVVVSLPGESGVARLDLFSRTRAVTAAIGERIAVEIHRQQPGEQFDHVLPAGLRQIARHLFANPRLVPRAADATGIELQAIADQQGEVTRIAADVKSLLLAGVPAGEIVIGTRSFDDYRDRIEEVFSAAGIPFAFDGGRPLAREPLCRAVMLVLQLEAEDWPFLRLMALVDSALLCPPESAAVPRGAARDVSRQLRQFKLSEGRRQILERLERLAARAGESASDAEQATDVNAQSAVRALHLLNWLSAATDGLRRAHDLLGWANTIASLIELLGLAGAKTARDPAFEVLKQALFDAARAEALLAGEQKTIPLSQFVVEFADLSTRIVCGTAPRETGRIRILPAEQVRNLDVPHLYLAGLTERSFPAATVEDCLYGESDRRQLNQQGLALTDRVGRAREEMLLFYNVVTRARKRLVLTWPAVNSSGEPISASPYVTAVQDLFAQGTLPIQIEERLNPVPDAKRLLSPADARVFGMSEALAQRPALLRAWCEMPENGELAAHVVAAVEMQAQRFETRGFTSFEGLLENPIHHEWLVRHFGEAHEFSATELESFAACPFRHLLESVLGVEPLSSPEVETEYGRRGSLVHDILAEVHRLLANSAEMHAAGDPTAQATAITRRFAQILADRMSNVPLPSELHRALHDLEVRLLSEWGAAYGTQWKAYAAMRPEGLDHPLLPAHFEVAFGNGAAKHEASAAFGPLLIGTALRTVRVTGRIDRIDVARLGEQLVFAVVDYKTGSREKSSTAAITSGRALQLVLYSLAVTRLGIAGAGALPLQLGYWLIRDTGFQSGLGGRKDKAGRLKAINPTEWATLVGEVEAIVPRLASAIRAGQFPVQNDDRDCTGHCPYSTMCRVQQIRPLAQTLDKTWTP